MKFILSFLFFFTINANAQLWNPACPGTGFSWTNFLLMKISEAKEHPYTEACEPFSLETGEFLTAKSNKEKIPLNVLQQQLPKKTMGGKPIKPFFADIRKRIQNRINEERKKITQAKACLKSSSADQCLKINTATKGALGIEDPVKFKDYKFSNLVRDARFNLILSTTPSSFLGKHTGQAGALNFNMHNQGLYKEKSWDQSLGQETKDARQALLSYFAEAKKSLDKPYDPNSIKQKVEVEGAVNAMRLTHLEAYTTLLALNPILHFIESEKPDKAEVLKATEQMLASLDKEEKWLKETTESLDSGEALNKDLLKLLNYQSETTEALAEKNEFCGVARDFKQLYDAKNLGQDIVITTPIIFASIFLPMVSAPTRALLGSMTAEAVFGGALVANRQVELNESAYQVKGRFDPQSKKELQTLSKHLSDRQMEIYFAALGVAIPAKLLLKKQKLAPTFLRRSIDR